MLLVRDPASTCAIADPAIRALVVQRFSAWSEADPEEGELCGYVIVVEQGDTVEDINAQAGFPILSNRFTGIRFDSPGFTPSFEIMEEHPSCFEIVFVLGDDGYGIELFIPKGSGIDADLLAMCKRYAVSAVPDVPLP